MLQSRSNRTLARCLATRPVSAYRWLLFRSEAFHELSSYGNLSSKKQENELERCILIVDAIFDRVDAESRYRGLTHRFSLLPFDGCVTDADATAEEDAASAAKFPVEASTSLEAVASAWQETESVGARKECGARHPAVALRRFHEAMDFFANDAEGRFTQASARNCVFVCVQHEVSSKGDLN